jgi:hypothetical protein
MGGTGSMTLGDYAPILIAAAVIVAVIVAFVIVRAARRGS